MSCACAVLSCWALWEQDVFWQVRAGTELVDTLALPQTDTWSYTAAGREWHNVQWLSTVVLGLVFRVAGVGGLVALRALLAAALVFSVGNSVELAAPKLGRPLSFSLLALVYLALAPRIQVRPELFALLCFTTTISVWVSGLDLHKARLLTVLLLVLTTNFHAGMTPFVGLAGMSFVLGSGLAASNLRWCAGLLVASFCNPEPLAGLSHTLRHLFYFGGKVLPNPEQVRLDWATFYSGPERWHLWSGALLLLLAAKWLWASPPQLEPGYGRRWWPRAVLLVLAALCIERVRATPFLVLYAAPLPARLLQHWQRERGWGAGKLRAVAAPILVGSALLSVLAPPYPFGLGLTPGMWPVDSVEFIRRTRPQSNLFHTHSVGAYLDVYLQEYKVLGDPREVPFRDFEAAYLAAYESQAGLNELVERLASTHSCSTFPLPGPQTTAPATSTCSRPSRQRERGPSSSSMPPPSY